MTARRWDTDARGRGEAPGDLLAPNLIELLEAMRDPGWVTEDPEIHLLARIGAACRVEEAPFRLVAARSERDVYVIDLEPREESASRADFRRAVFALIGSIAEDSTHVRQRTGGAFEEFDIATGTLATETAFAPHGHQVRLRIRVSPR